VTSPAFRLRLRAVEDDPAEVDDRDTLKLFERAARTEPYDGDYYYILGQALLRAGRFSDAVGVCREAARLNRHDPDYHYALGAAVWGLERYEEAEAAFRDAVRLHPDDTRALNGLGCALTALDAIGKPARDHAVRPPLSVGSRAVLALGDAAGGLGAARRRVANLLLVAGLAVIGYAAYRAVPPYISRYLLQDDIAGIAGAPVTEDADILDRLMHAVRERGLTAHIRESDFEIQTRSKWRRILCRYEMPVEILPGLASSRGPGPRAA
jgi:tetratricopeptide (TPR) repeat protein